MIEKLSDRELMVITYDVANSIHGKEKELQQLIEQQNLLNTEFSKRVQEEKTKINASTNIQTDTN